MGFRDWDVWFRGFVFGVAMMENQTAQKCKARLYGGNSELVGGNKRALVTPTRTLGHDESLIVTKSAFWRVECTIFLRVMLFIRSGD